MPPDRAKSFYAPLTKEGREAVVSKLIEDVAAVYFSSEVGSRMAEGLRGSLKSGEFDKIANPALLAQKLTEQLRMLGNNDKHLEVRFVGSPARVEKGGQDSLSTNSAQKQGSFIEAEKTDGIGYLKLSSFEPVEPSKDATESEKVEAAQNKKTLDEALAKLAGARSLIIDLRENGGGDPRTVAYLASYFNPPDKHINSIMWRNNPEPGNPDIAWNEKEKAWEWSFKTSKPTGGPSFGPDVPVQILTGPGTFSAAEEFAYDMRALGRARTVGERTGGGANPGGVVELPGNFKAFIPSGRASCPLTGGGNWEGSGVEIDREIMPGEDALEVARRT